MRYLTFLEPESSQYDVCFLSPELHKQDMQRLYIGPHLAGMESRLLAYSLEKRAKKTPAAIQKEYLAELLPVLRGLGAKYLVVCDAEYFRTLSKGQSPENSLGCILEGRDDFAGFKLVYCPNFRSVFFNPDKVKAEITQALYALKTHAAGKYCEPGIDIIKFEAYPDTVQDIKFWLEKLIAMDCDLTSDIETFSLKHHSAGIGTIGFAWSKHEGIAFPIDLHEDNIEIRGLLLEFFRAFKRKMIWHNITFDIYVLVYQLCMEHLLDTKGMLEGLELFLTGQADWDDTKIISYLATNSCAGNKLGLKHQAREFTGKYAIENIKDIRKIPLPKLLRYNLIDCLGTWFVHEKHWDTMVKDQQLPIYEELLKPSVVDVIQMQLTGLPMDMKEVHKLRDKLTTFLQEASDKMQSNAKVQQLIHQRNLDWVEKKNFTLKVKRVTLADAKEVFNPGSDQQLQRLLYDEQFMGLPIIDLTDSKLPSTKADTLEKLRFKTDNEDVLEFIGAVLEYKSAETIYNTFLPNFLNAVEGPDGWHYLFGNFNIGGTVSGRLSSSGPNLQNMPANDKKNVWAKDVKRCFKAPPGRILIGLDFSSLEDRISALTTKDTNKLKVYKDGYDGHCLRAHSYFGNQMPGIDANSVASINTIETLYPALRQDSKTPTFLLTYGGTYRGIMDKMGWDIGKARLIEERYHALYKESDEWVAKKIEEAGQTGYVTVAFGLRLRTPLLRQVVLGNSRTPYEAESEARTAGNACGQSYGLLNNRASVAFMRKVRSSEYALDIRPCAHIHDAQYLTIPEEIAPLLYVNENLVKEVEWQDDPAIAHDQVKLGGQLHVFFPNWACEMKIPNDAPEAMIKELALAHWNKYCR